MLLLFVNSIIIKTIRYVVSVDVKNETYIQKYENTFWKRFPFFIGTRKAKRIIIEPE